MKSIWDWDSGQKVLPNPARYENGDRPCNEPLVINGYTVGHCERHIKLRRKKHRGKHRIEWE